MSPLLLWVHGMWSMEKWKRSSPFFRELSGLGVGIMAYLCNCPLPDDVMDLEVKPSLP